MTTVDLAVSCKIEPSPRVLQMTGMFDLPQTGESRVEWHGDVPLDERPWNVGLIVGPSGSGKSTLARELFHGRLVSGFDWPADQAVVDAFPEAMSVKAVSALLGSIGFNTPPSWLRPYRVLSNGEQFRVTVARALAEAGDNVVVVDEFTSVIDRQVAKVASHSVQKAVRKRNLRFVAVSCHFDVLDWLQPDWVLQADGMAFTWRSLQRRPSLELAVHPVDRAAWATFKPHHYLTGTIGTGALCYGAFLGDHCIAFTSHVPFPHPHVKNIRRLHRTVVLPDYQGLAVGGVLTDRVAAGLRSQGFRVRRSIAHPATIAYCMRSPLWVAEGRNRLAASTKKSTLSGASGNKWHNRAGLRSVTSFEYCGPGIPFEA